VSWNYFFTFTISTFERTVLGRFLSLS
jgi:hypothetical protein